MKGKIKNKSTGGGNRNPPLLSGKYNTCWAQRHKNTIVEQRTGTD